MLVYMYHSTRMETSQASKKTKLLVGGYFSSMRDQDARKRYMEKLRCIGGLDPYETERKEWKVDVDSCLV